MGYKDGFLVKLCLVCCWVLIYQVASSRRHQWDPYGFRVKDTKENLLNFKSTLEWPQTWNSKPYGFRKSETDL